MPSVWFSGVVKAVTLETRELEVQRQDSPIGMNFEMAPKVEIYRRGEELQFGDLRPGDIVTVFYEGEGRATHIEVFPPKRRARNNRG